MTENATVKKEACKAQLTAEEVEEACRMYSKVKRTLKKGQDVSIKNKADGKICVYAVDVHLA